jgi:mono/diheme cytochrome c family protein
MKYPRDQFTGLLVGIILTFGVGESVRGADGEELFAKYCASCHGKDGKAQTPIARKLGVKDLTQSKLTDAEIQKQILEGKRDEHDKEKMPAFKTKLSDDEIKSLVTVVKELRK